MWYGEDDDDGEVIGEEPCTGYNPSSFSPPTCAATCRFEAQGLLHGGMAPSPSSSDDGPLDLPRNLYLAAPGLIGMGAPTCAEHIRNLHALYNVRLVINLRERPNSDDWFEGLPVRSVHVPIPGYCAPSLEAMLALLGLIRAALGDGDEISSEDEEDRQSRDRPVVAVHCLEGKGRTGTICAAYLLHQHRDLAADEAMGLIRSRSPLSVESKEQEEFLHRFAQLLRCSTAVASEGPALKKAEGVLPQRRDEQRQQRKRCGGAKGEGRFATSPATLAPACAAALQLARMDSASEEEGGNWYCS